MAKSQRSASRKSGWSPEPLRGSVFWLLAGVTRFRTTSPAPTNKGNMLVPGDSSAGELPAAQWNQAVSTAAGVIINCMTLTGVSGPHRYSIIDRRDTPCFLTGSFRFHLKYSGAYQTCFMGARQNASEEVLPFFLLVVIFQFFLPGDIVYLQPSEYTDRSWLGTFFLLISNCYMIPIAPVRHMGQHVSVDFCPVQIKAHESVSKRQEWTEIPAGTAGALSASHSYLPRQCFCQPLSSANV